jgi:hypothetical protein
VFYGLYFGVDIRLWKYSVLVYRCLVNITGLAFKIFLAIKQALEHNNILRFRQICDLHVLYLTTEHRFWRGFHFRVNITIAKMRI